MARTATETTLERPQGQPITSFAVPQGAKVQPPADNLARDAGFVAARVGVARRPPALALLLPRRGAGLDDAKADHGAPIGARTEIDLSPVATLPPDLLAWRVIDLAARLGARDDLASAASARPGLGALLLQARMFQHLHILQSTAAEGSE